MHADVLAWQDKANENELVLPRLLLVSEDRTGPISSLARPNYNLTIKQNVWLHGGILPEKMADLRPSLILISVIYCAK